MKYYKIIYGKNSSHSNYIYKIGEVNNAYNWNQSASSPSEMGGFSFLEEDKVLKFLNIGDTIYDVTLPLDAEIVNCYSSEYLTNTYRTNKIILSNPKKISDELAMKFYQRASFSLEWYAESLLILIKLEFIDTATLLVRDKVNINNVDLFINKLNSDIDNSTYKIINDKLLQIKNNII